MKDLHLWNVNQMYSMIIYIYISKWIKEWAKGKKGWELKITLFVHVYEIDGQENTGKILHSQITKRISS